jgi:hypothetical protein
VASVERRRLGQTVARNAISQLPKRVCRVSEGVAIVAVRSSTEDTTLLHLLLPPTVDSTIVGAAVDDTSGSSSTLKQRSLAHAAVLTVLWLRNNRAYVQATVRWFSGAYRRAAQTVRGKLGLLFTRDSLDPFDNARLAVGEL